MKRIGKLLLAIIVFIGIEKAVRTQTHGFRIEKTQADFLSSSQWNLEMDEQEERLNQPFYFLGSGVQCYAFIGADQKTVLKVFKHYHFGLPTPLLEKIPLPKFLASWRALVLEKRAKRLHKIFSSAHIASTTLSEQTGVFYLNINPQEGKYPEVTIYDNIGISHSLDLNTTPFLLQRKADLIFPYLETHREEAKKVIDSLFACIANRSHKGVSNRDPVVRKNFGILEGEVIEIDIGSFASVQGEKSPLLSKREIFYQTRDLKNWVEINAPELREYFNRKLFQALRT